MMRLFLLITGVALTIAGAASAVDGSLGAGPPTPQVSDLLLFDGDTLAINALPLEAYFEQGHERSEELFPSCLSTACGRGYQALWQIENDRLYLREIHSCCEFGKRLSYAELDTLLSGRYEGGRAFAEWYSGILPSPQGERLKYEHIGWSWIYEYEVLFHIEKGRLVGRDTVSNVPTRDPQFPGGLDSLRAYVYRHLNWEAVPHPDTGMTVIPIVEIDTTGQAHLQRVFRTKHPDTEVEIRRVFERLPRWQVGYYKGKKIPFSFGLPIPLSDSLRWLYAQ